MITTMTRIRTLRPRALVIVAIMTVGAARRRRVRYA
jgi:hypothetical protein